MSQSRFSHDLAVVTATKDRPRQLTTLLSNLKGQSFRPQQVLVVDGGDHPVEDIVGSVPELPIEYIRVVPPGLTKQKNAGVARVRSDIDLIAFVDDDVCFEDGALEAMMSFWEEAPEQLGGASFNLEDFHDSLSWLKSLPQRIFFIDNRGFGKVSRSGFNTPIWNASTDSAVQWLGGGYTVWNKRVFDQWQFDEWFTGSGMWEDVHFSYRVGKHYQLAVVAGAKAAHVEPAMTPTGQVKLGKTQVLNWLYFVRQNPDLSVPMCLWACVGRTATNFTKGLGGFNRSFLLRAMGNSIGLFIGAARLAKPMAKEKAR